MASSKEKTTKKPFPTPTVTKIGQVAELSRRGMGTDGQGNYVPTG
jgi:hypothetical protein